MIAVHTETPLEAAERRMESARLAARRVVEAFDLWVATPDPSIALASRLTTAIIDLDSWTDERFVRPGCVTEDPAHGTDAACVEGSDCTGYHPWQDE